MIVTAHAYFGLNGGCSQHATNFFAATERQGVTVIRRNLSDPKCRVPTTGIHIFLCGVQEFPHVIKQAEAVKGYKIAYVAWETTEYPESFMEALRYVDQLWVPSGWQAECSVLQLPKGSEGSIIPVNVVPEGVDGKTFRPEFDPRTTSSGIGYRPSTRFMIFGRWEDRKCTKEMIENWLAVFKNDDNVELVVSADNAFPVDQYKTTEERLSAYGLTDPRIKVIHFPPKDEYAKYLQEGHVLLNVSRGEGWGLPIIEGLASGIPVVCTDWSGNTEYCTGACTVPISGQIDPFNVYGVPNCPGKWGEPNWESYRWWLRELYEHYQKYRESALKLSVSIRENFSWDKAAEKAIKILDRIPTEISPKLEVADPNPVSYPVATVPPPEAHQIDLVGAAYNAGYEIHGTQLLPKQKSVFVVTCYPDSMNRMITLEETLEQIHALGYRVIVSTCYALPAPVQEQADFVLYEKNGQNHLRNAVLFCAGLGEWGWLHFMDYDLEVDLEDFLCRIAFSRSTVVVSRDESMISGRVSELAKLFEADTPDWSGCDRIDIQAAHRFKGTEDQERKWPADTFDCHFVDGPFLNITGISNKEYLVSYSTPQEGNMFEHIQKPGSWSRPNRKYYQDWTIRAEYAGEEVFRHKMDLSGKRVLICMGSKALGDTIAWIPYVEEFRKKHGCHCIVSSWWREILDYPELELVAPGSKVEGIYASYDVGCFDGNLEKNVSDWRTVPMQQIASDILGLDYEPLRCRLKTDAKNPLSGKYFCFSEHSTMQAKLWNNLGAWQKTIDAIRDMGYEAVSISKEPTELKNCKRMNKRKIEETIAVLRDAAFYVGLGHGPSWLAWALGIPAVLISGFSQPWEEFPTPWRVINKDVCHGCFNNTTVAFDRGWGWCPHGKDFECTKAITPEMVLSEVNNLIGAGK